MKITTRTILQILLTLLSLQATADNSEAGGARYLQPDYEEPRVVYDFYLDDPNKIHSALYWIRATMNPLIESPYDMAPEFMDLIVVIHGTEIVTLVKKNDPRYHSAVERMRYYHSLGVKFRVCELAADDYGYQLSDFHDFVEMVPSAMTELVHWQQQGYALITPLIMDKKYSIEEIR